MTPSPEEVEERLLARLRAEAEDRKRFPRGHSVEGLHLWQLGYGEIELALYRLRKRGLVVYDKKQKAWRIR